MEQINSWRFMELVMGNIWKHMETYEKPGESWENEMILELAMEVCGIYGKKHR